MRKIKTILGIVFSLAIVTTMNTTVFAANDSGIPERRGVYIRECVGYEPNYTNIDYTHKLLGSVSGDNTQGSSPMQITYQYEQRNNHRIYCGLCQWHNRSKCCFCKNAGGSRS